MKNRNIQFKPTAGVLMPLLLACFAAVFISIPTPAAARDLVPFKATFTGSSTSVPGFPCAVLRSDIVGGGHGVVIESSIFHNPTTRVFGEEMKRERHCHTRQSLT